MPTREDVVPPVDDGSLDACVGVVLKRERERLGLSEGRFYGKSRSAGNRYENGSRLPTLDTANRFLAPFRVRLRLVVERDP